MGIPFKHRLLQGYYTLHSYKMRNHWKGTQKIFCLSMKKTGTTSVGDFFVQVGYPVVRSDLAQLRGWNKYWYMGETEKMFQDPVFKNYQVFEDSPFWAGDFYRELHEKYPEALFILFTRDAEAWYDSLVHHGKGGVLGNKQFHACIYQIPEAVQHDFDISAYKAHYIKFYQSRNQEVLQFFKSEVKGNFFHAHLDDKDKWHKLAEFTGISIPENFNIHSNRKN